jgi:putative transposase
LTLIDGRHHIKLNVGQYQTGKLKGKKPTSAQLCKHRDGNYYIHIQVKDTPPEPIKSSQVIGVDLGRTDIAVTSEGEKWSSKHISGVNLRKKGKSQVEKKTVLGYKSKRFSEKNGNLSLRKP